MNKDLIDRLEKSARAKLRRSPGFPGLEKILDWQAAQALRELEEQRDNAIEQGIAEGRIASKNIREAERLEAENTRLRAEIDASLGLKCPNCNDEGFTPVQVGPVDWEQEQCEFCYTVKDSMFMRAAADSPTEEG